MKRSTTCNNNFEMKHLRFLYKVNKICFNLNCGMEFYTIQVFLVGFNVPYSLYFVLDNLYFGVWKTLSQIQDENLRETASKLPELLDNGLAKSTLSKYKPGWNKWINWVRTYPEVNSCPADAFFVAVYINELVLQTSSLSSISQAFFGIRWGHIRCGLFSPTDHPFVKLAFEGAKRIVKSVKNQKEPLPLECLTQIVNKFGFNGNVIELRFLIISLLGFAGFFRISELLQVQIKHIKIFDSYIDIFLERTKNDQHRGKHCKN